MNNKKHLSPACQLAADCRWLETLFADVETHPKIIDTTQATFPNQAKELALHENARLAAFIHNDFHKMMSIFALGSQMHLIAAWRANGQDAYYDKALDTASVITLAIMPEPLLSERGIFSTLNIACQITQLALESETPVSPDELNTNAMAYFRQAHEYKNLHRYGIQPP